MCKKIVISGWYGHGNIGDEAILQAMIDTFTEEYKDCEITVLSFNPKYTEKTQQVKAVEQLPFGKKSWIRLILTLDILKTINTIKNCDIFIMGGGGFLSDWQPEVPRQWLKQFKLAKFFKKETYLYAIGAGPFLSEEGKRVTKDYIDNYVDKITVRDDESFRQLVDNVGINKPIEITVDPVTNMKVHKYTNSKCLKDNSISLIFTEYYKNKYFNQEHNKKWNLLFKAFCAQIEAVIENGFKPKLVFFQKNMEKELAAMFKEVFDDKIDVEFPNGYKEAIEILDSSEAVISFRLHGNILSYAMKKPFLPIIYHHKTSDFLKQISYKYNDCILEVGDDKVWPYKDIDLIEWQNKTKKFIHYITQEERSV